MMTGLLDALSSEVEKIVYSPYLVSLQKLHDILLQADDFVIREWADGHPCQLGVLASAVREALQLWPYALRVLQNLSRSTAFRDTVLQQDPNLLDALLTKATASPRDFDAYCGVCTSLLQEPLPEPLPVPASAQKFFLAVFDRTVRSPSIHNLGIVFSLLDGPCRESIGLLPSQKLDGFLEHLRQTIKNLPSHDDHALTLLCLAIGTVLLEQMPPEDIVIPSTLPGNTPSTRPDRPPRAYERSKFQEFFVGEKSHKTLDLLALRVYFACKKNDALIQSEAVNTIRAARRTFKAFPAQVISNWLRRSGHWMEKLVESLKATHLSPELQLEAWAFVAGLTESSPDSIRNLAYFEKLLLNIDQLSIADRQLQSALDATLRSFAPRLNVQFFSDLLCRLLKAVAQPSQQRFGDLRPYEVLVQSLTDVAQSSPQTRNPLLQTLASNELQESLRCFLAVSIWAQQTDGDRGAACSHASLEVRRRLGLAICSLLLKSAFAAQTDGPGIAFAIALPLVDKQQEFARQLSPCAHSIQYVQRAPTISIAQLERTQNVQTDSQDWRARLAAEFQTEAKLRHEATIRTVDQICRDLEQRCEEAEAPFREEQKRRKELQDQYDEISKHAADIEAQAIDQRLYVEALENEKSQMQADLNAAQSNNDDLSDRVAELRRRLQEANQQAERQLAAMRTENADKELQLRTSIAAKETSLEEQEKIIRETVEEKRATQDELQSVRQELKELRDSHHSLSEKLSEAEHDLSVEKDLRADKKAQLKIMSAEKADLMALKERLQGEVREMNVQLSALNEKYEGLMVSSKEEKETLVFENQRALHNLSEQAAESKIQHDEELRRAHEEITQLQQAHDSLTLELQEKGAEMAKLMRKVDKLSKGFADKDAELTEARSIQKNMLGALGIREEVATTLLQTSATRSDPPRFHGTQRKSHPGVVSHDHRARDEEVVDDMEPAMDVNRSFESASSKSGPTPKRAKPRKSFKVPTIQQPRPSVFPRSAKAVRRQTVPGRLPLADVSAGRGNMSPVRIERSKDPFKHMELADRDREEQHMEQCQGMEDLPFDTSELLTSTPATPLPILPRKQRSFGDETTVEF